MKKTARATQRQTRLSCATLCLLTSFLSGCLNFNNDCGLFKICGEDLIALAKKRAGDAGAACEQCLLGSCEALAHECANAPTCGIIERCRLSRSPLAYQTCLNDLVIHGYSDGKEGRPRSERIADAGADADVDGGSDANPWEGTDHRFDDCLRAACKPECRSDRWSSCGLAGSELYQNLRLRLAVRLFPEFRPLKDFQIRACDSADGDGCNSRWYEPEHEDKPGYVELPDISINAEKLYFEIISKNSESPLFPPTLYYPGWLGSEIQHTAVYVVSANRIGRGNEDLLGVDSGVLTDSTQSVILPDSCIWDSNSAPDVQIFVEDKNNEVNLEVRQCRDVRAPDGGVTSLPCIWYSSGSSPDLGRSKTDGTGGGIVGLTEGEHTIRIVSRGEVVARRKIRVRNGAMTIARTWPLPKEDRTKVNMSTP